MVRLGQDTGIGMVAVVAASAAVLAFANSLGNDFAYDDLPVLAANEDIHSLTTLSGTALKPYWPNRQGRALGLWRPVTTWVLGLQWTLWRGNPTGFHAVNILLNGTAAALVAILLGRLLPPSAALFGALVFAVHPVHVEAVANVVGLSELLAANAYLGACLLVTGRRRRLGIPRLAATGGLFLVAVLSKESAVTLPGAVLLIDAAREDPRLSAMGPYLKERLVLYTVLALVTAVFLMGRVLVLGGIADPLPPLGAEILASGEVPRIWTVMNTWPEVFRLLFFPLELSSDYTPGVIPVSYGWTARNGLGMVLALTALVVAWRTWRSAPLTPRRSSPRAAGFGVLWFIITALPTANLLFLTGMLLAERTLFLPSVGLAAGAGWMLAQLARERPRVGVLAAVTALSLLLCRTIARNPTWRDNAAVFSTLLRDRPESGRAQWVIGDTYFALGEHGPGLAAYRRAMGRIGGSYALLVEIGRNLLAERLDQSAEHVLSRAWRDYPQYGAAPALLAVLHDRQGRWVLSEASSRAALRVKPHDGVQLHLLARSLEAQGRAHEAIAVRLRIMGESAGPPP